MLKAIEIAKNGLGRVAPNPSVGCVIVRNEKIIAISRTADGGRPHAETQAIEIAGEKAKGADMYVTLEPCFHTGKTPPCVDDVINSGIKRIFIARKDPDSKTSGKSIDKLISVGIEVKIGLLEDEATKLNEGFFSVINSCRPFVTLKCATSLDGKIATMLGDSKWITGVAARKHVHIVRSCYDAILVGVGTVLGDDPMLTTRIEGIDHKSYRVILDPNLSIPLNSKIVKTARECPVIIVHSSNEKMEAKKHVLQMMGIELISSDLLEDMLQKLACHGVTRLLIEGGSKIFTSFIKSGLYNRLLWYRAPKIIGSDGLDIFGSLDIQTMDQIIELKRTDIKIFDNDILEIFDKER